VRDHASPCRPPCAAGVVFAAVIAAREVHATGVAQAHLVDAALSAITSRDHLARGRRDRRHAFHSPRQGPDGATAGNFFRLARPRIGPVPVVFRSSASNLSATRKTLRAEGFVRWSFQ